MANVLWKLFLGMTADTFHGNSVGIGEAADFTPPEKCKLHTLCGR